MNERKGPGWALPLFITARNKHAVGALVIGVTSFLYLFSNHVHFSVPQLLPLSAIDRAIPLLPWTVWIYLSEYVFFVAVYLVCRDLANLNKWFYSFLSLQAVSFAIFLLWPTTFPRDLYPLVPAEMDRFTLAAFTALRQGDTPANCCPSLHVSSVYLSTFIFLDDQKEKFPFFFLWGTAIALSTLPTKQHYLVDVIAGFLMSVLFYRIFHRYVVYRPLAQASRAQGALQAKR
jgi:membrane-associated phospholipid phosphatase